MPTVDLEAELTSWIRSEFDGVTSCTELPADLDGSLPLVQVEVIGGAGGLFGSAPRIEVDAFATGYEAARDLAAGVHNGLMTLRGIVGQAVIADVRCDSLPSRRPYETTSGLRRVGASYTISAHPISYV
jgi:hypothetical protein